MRASDRPVAGEAVEPSASTLGNCSPLTCDLSWPAKITLDMVTGSLSGDLAFVVLDGDRLVEIDDPGVGERDAKDIAGEVVERGL